jgi:hypothetical protein
VVTVLFAEIVSVLQEREDTHPRIIISEAFTAMKIDAEDFYVTTLSTTNRWVVYM